MKKIFLDWGWLVLAILVIAGFLAAYFWFPEVG